MDPPAKRRSSYHCCLCGPFSDHTKKSHVSRLEVLISGNEAVLFEETSRILRQLGSAKQPKEALELPIGADAASASWEQSPGRIFARLLCGSAQQSTSVESQHPHSLIMHSFLLLATALWWATFQTHFLPKHYLLAPPSTTSCPSTTWTPSTTSCPSPSPSCCSTTTCTQEFCLCCSSCCCSSGSRAKCHPPTTPVFISFCNVSAPLPPRACLPAPS